MICERSSPLGFFFLLFWEDETKAIIFTHTKMHTLPGQTPAGFLTLQPWECNQKIPLPCRQHAQLCAATSGQSRKCSYDQWQADRLQMCTCQINKCYRVNNAFIWINLTASVWENSSENIHHHKCLLNHIINRCVWLGFCCQRPTVCFILMI